MCARADRGIDPQRPEQDQTQTQSELGGAQRPKIHQCGISRNRLTLKSSHIPAVSAVVAADWLRLDGSMET